MRTLTIILLLGLWTAPAAAQFNRVHEGGARAVALGGASTALRGDVWGHGNPASWATLAAPSAAVMVSQAFGLTATRLGAAALAVPTRWGTFASAARTYGFSAYRETRLTLGYARSLSLGTSRQFHAALAARYHHLAIENYGSDGTLGLSVGWLVQILPSLTLGARAVNLNMPALGDGEELPRTLALGMAYAPSGRVRVLAGAQKDVRFPLSFRGGVELHPVSVLFLRVGAATRPTRFAGGVGIEAGPVAAHLAAERHQVLGWSPALSVRLSW